MSMGAKDTEFTDSARKALDELVEDFRQQLIRQSVENAQKGVASPTEVTVQDVITASNTIRESSTKRVSLAVDFGFMLAGFIVAVFANSVFAGITENSGEIPLWFGRQPSEVLTWIGVMLGGLALLALLAGLIFQYRGAQQKPVPGTTRLMQSWIEFEKALRLYAARELGESRSTIRLAELFSFLSKQETFTYDELARLREIVTMRNDVAHSQRSYSDAEIDDAVATLDSATKRIE